ncbi:hypothetical protein BU24DRAFT_111090 [Aaosphaeria arxii CBS 175.79]|uniref:Integral membrane protein n=1 Tax=Aaosphaeria arxii CBS 175.79 TaxID=1450172 RepID=A0A6A5Y0G9_9PLEO|nr:uncharacterized protein BU24DRAFT_111090 [Aaosphaeria arxii CBS 175.79]KAF2019038.1 hypothetical protein BU24DRAFT_111090 [Aaosphaeria arxii CBS 175.79]
MVFDKASNCSVVPDATATDAGVAGAGTLLSFVITNFISLGLSAVIIILNLKKTTSAPISRKLLLSFSDQQIVTGIGIQCIGLSKMNTMVSYHFFIIWLLSTLSTATNLSTLLALVNDFKRDWVLRWLRQFFMFVNLLLGVLCGIFILQTVTKNLEPRLPISCVWEVPSRGASSNSALSIAGTIAVIAGNAIVFVFGTWYLHMREHPRWLKPVQIVGLLFLVASGVGATVRIFMVSQAFGSPPESVRLIGNGEKEWSYGQLLPLLLLILPIISTIEIARGEMRVTPSKADDDDTKPLFNDTELQYQPSPMFGESNGLFRK